MVGPRDQNTPEKMGEASPADLHPCESGPEADQRPGGVITSTTLFGPVFAGPVLYNYQRWLKTV